MTSKTKTEFLSVREKWTTFGPVFIGKIRLNENKNWAVCSLKEKITLKL